MQQPQRDSYDVIIVGGAKIGSSIAWFLKHYLDFDGTVLVVEKDPSYAKSSTAATNSCMRQQFSSQLNIQISQFAAEFVKSFPDFFPQTEDIPTIHFESFGYLYLADNEGFAENLRQAQNVQQQCGAATKLLSTEEIQALYPFYIKSVNE